MSGKKILIVDDNKTYLTLASSLLQDAGFDTCMSESIWISRVINQYKPSLVLMDVNIGSSNGTSAVVALKKRSLGDGIKIFLHSSEPDSVLSKLSAECGADGFIVKDGKGENLVGAVRKALNCH